MLRKKKKITATWTRNGVWIRQQEGLNAKMIRVERPGKVLRLVEKMTMMEDGNSGN